MNDEEEELPWKYRSSFSIQKIMSGASWKMTDKVGMRIRQHELGDVVFVELVEVGTAVAKGDPIGTVESVKAVSEIYAPVDGEVVEVNGVLMDTPELINQDCYGEAWMVVLKVNDPSQVDTLMDARTYQAYIEAEAK